MSGDRGVCVYAVTWEGTEVVKYQADRLLRRAKRTLRSGMGRKDREEEEEEVWPGVGVLARSSSSST